MPVTERQSWWLEAAMARAVRTRLTAAGLSQADAAAYLGISQKHLSQVLTLRAGATMEMWRRLLAFVDVEPGDLGV